MPKMLGLEGEEIHQSASGWSPVYVEDNLGVMSIGFMLPDKDDAVIWRGPRKNALIKQFLKDVHWGESLDYLIIDSPPGTSDEHISVAQYLGGVPALAGAVVVTTPQEVAIADVRKEINFCKKTGVKVLGVVENMSGLRQSVEDFTFTTADGRDVTADIMKAINNNIQVNSNGNGTDTANESNNRIFAETEVFHASGGGAAAMAKDMNVPFLGKVPLDGALSRAGERGVSVFDNKTEACCAPALRKIIDQLKVLVD
jgi:Mrp family chromosome partitioning ATPase